MTQQTINITTYDAAARAFRLKELRQDQYDTGAVIMADVLVNLHGQEHRTRRRMENKLFRRQTFEIYERQMFPAIIEETLAPHLAEGRAELVSLGHHLMMNLAAMTAGVDRPLGTPEETERLHDYLMVFIEGAVLTHHTGDREAMKKRILDALAEWKVEFLTPSIERRQALLARHAAGEIGDDELPRDVLTTLLAHKDELEISDDVITRETAFMLLAAAHTSATAYGRSVFHILKWLEEHPEDVEKVRSDRLFVQRCVHEMVRLNPSSPVTMRRALHDTPLADGTVMHEGDKLVIDLGKVNRDESIFGPDAAEFNPYRAVPQGIAPFGLSFGTGMHVCIGQDLAAGVPATSANEDEHLFGLVTIAVQRLFDANVRFDPEHPPVRDESTERPYWSEFQVLLDRELVDTDQVAGGPGREEVAATAPAGRLQVVIDHDSCISSGKCVADEPQGFAFDDDELANPTPGAGQLPEGRLVDIARGCPNGAITILRDGVVIS